MSKLLKLLAFLLFIALPAIAMDEKPTINILAEKNNPSVEPKPVPELSGKKRLIKPVKKNEESPSSKIPKINGESFQLNRPLFSGAKDDINSFLNPTVKTVENAINELAKEKMPSSLPHGSTVHGFVLPNNFPYSSRKHNIQINADQEAIIYDMLISSETTPNIKKVTQELRRDLANQIQQTMNADAAEEEASKLIDAMVKRIMKNVFEETKDQKDPHQGQLLGRGSCFTVYKLNSSGEVKKVLKDELKNKLDRTITRVYEKILAYHEALERFEDHPSIIVAKNTNNFFKDGFLTFEEHPHKVDLTQEENQNTIRDIFLAMLEDQTNYLPDFIFGNVHQRDDGIFVLIDASLPKKSGKLAFHMGRDLASWLGRIKDAQQKEAFIAPFNESGNKPFWLKMKESLTNHLAGFEDIIIKPLEQ